MLQEGPRGIAELYNDFCARRQLWGFALEMVALAHYTDKPWIQDLWDVYLRQVCGSSLGPTQHHHALLPPSGHVFG